MDDYTLYIGYGRGRKLIITDVEWADELEMSNEEYSFDILEVLKRSDGYYLTTDSGCSCPTPFESHHWPQDFTGPLTAEQALEEVTSLIEIAKENSSSYSPGPDSEHVAELLSRII